MKATTSTLTVLAILVLLPGFGYADETIVAEADTEDTYTHDGFFLRLGIGPSAIGAALEHSGADGSERALGNVGSQFELSIGGAVAENIVLHADLFVSTAHEPYGTDDGDRNDYNNDEFLAMSGLGVGLTYYLMPMNLYLSGSILAAESSLVDTRDDGEELFATEHAVLCKFTVGKEWWISQQWGLGVAGTVYGGQGEGEMASGRNTDIALGGAAVLFSATYN